MKIYFECKYCAYKWDNEFWSESAIAGTECPKCKDKNFKATSKSPKSTIDYYQGTPAFEIEDDEPFDNHDPDYGHN